MDSGSATTATVRPAMASARRSFQAVAFAEDGDELRREEFGKGRLRRKWGGRGGATGHGDRSGEASHAFTSGRARQAARRHCAHPWISFIFGMRYRAPCCTARAAVLASPRFREGFARAPAASPASRNSPLNSNRLRRPIRDGVQPVNEVAKTSVTVAGEDPIISGMAGRYASALFELGARGNKSIDAVKADLDRFDAMVAESADLTSPGPQPGVRRR